MLRRGALCQAQQRGARQLPDRPRAGVLEPHDSRVAEDAHADGIGAVVVMLPMAMGHLQAGRREQMRSFVGAIPDDGRAERKAA